MRVRTPIAVFAAVGALVLLASCGSDGGHSSSSADAGRPVALVDALGDTVPLNGIPRRIVSLAPNVTEMVFALGAGQRLVGATDFCDYPPEALRIPRVGGFNIINAEAVVAASPDIVLAARGNNTEDLQTLRRMGITVFALRVDSIPQMTRELRTLSIILGKQEAADSLTALWSAQLAGVDSVLVTIPHAQRPRVFFGGVEEPIWSAGRGSYMDDLIRRAGGRNVLPDDAGAWPSVDLETIVRLDPEILLVSAHGVTDPGELLVRLSAAPGWSSLSAVRERRLVVCGDDALRPGPRMVGVVPRLARAFYPDRFPGSAD